MSEVTSIGTTIDDKYVVLELIGKGGMSNVWLARDMRLGKLWAIKEIKPNTGGVRGALLRQAMVDEANLMKRLDHPSIPRVVDSIDTGSTLFVVMDYVEGRPLSAVMRERGGPFDQKDVVEWGVRLCEVLSYLHNLNPAIIYRDLKPSNIMLRDDGSLRLIDFGVCMVCAPAAANDGKVVGTPGYSAPEQMRVPQGSRSQRLDETTLIGPAADVYALGTTLYALVTGHVPKRMVREDGTAHTVFDMRPIREWDASLSEGLERIVLKATASDPVARYADMEELRYDLEHYEELTSEWRRTQRRKVRGMWTRAAAALASALLGAACLMGSSAVKSSSYEELLFSADAASREATGERESDAEVLYAKAIAVDKDRCEAYRGLIGAYESDYRFTDAEERRWRKVCGQAQGMEQDPEYAQLCFDVGTCYLSYFGIDRAGGSVGNAAVASMEAAKPWFERAIAACEDTGARHQGLADEADLQTARVYATIAGFYDQVTRAGKEGRSATEAYGSFWHALDEAITNENELTSSEQSAEGVRARLCQVAVEAISSSTYLAGFARAGVGEQEARTLVGKVSLCVDGLADFERAEEYRQVYGPVFAEIRAGLDLVENNIRSTYHNPVSTLEGATDGQVRESVATRAATAVEASGSEGAL